MHRLRPLILVSLLVSLGALGLAGGCAESGSLPTQPVAAEPAGPWSVIYPVTTTETLNAAWGLDADDMWAVGYDGVILHYDGEHCEVVESPIDDSFRAIAGVARDDIWIMGYRSLVHWNGHRWRVVLEDLDADLRSIWCDGHDDIYLTVTARGDTCWYPEVRHFDGSTWQNLEFPREADSGIGRIWRTDPGDVLLVDSSQGLFRRDGDEWILCRNQYQFRDVAGEIAVGREPNSSETRLIRFDPDGEPYTDCEEVYFDYAYQIVASRVTLATNCRDLYGIPEHCDPIPYGRSFDRCVRDLAVPVLTGSTGNAVFAVGSEGLFLRGHWNDDLSLTWTDLVAGPTERIRNAVTGTDELVFVGCGHDRLLVREDDQWRLEEYDGIPNGPNLQILEDGTLVAWEWTYIAIRQPDGAWSEIPDGPDLRHLWTDGREEAVAVDHQMRMWTWSGGSWTADDSLETAITTMAGRSRDEIYGKFSDDILRRLEGTTWQHFLGDENDRVYDFYLSPWTDDIYLCLYRGDIGPITAVLRDGLIVELGGRGHWWRGDAVCEVSPGVLYGFGYSRIERFTGGEWVEEELPDLDDHGIGQVWGHPDQGLFVIDWNDRLHHRDLLDTTR